VTQETPGRFLLTDKNVFFRPFCTGEEGEEEVALTNVLRVARRYLSLCAFPLSMYIVSFFPPIYIRGWRGGIYLFALSLSLCAHASCFYSIYIFAGGAAVSLALRALAERTC